MHNLSSADRPTNGSEACANLGDSSRVAHTATTTNAGPSRWAEQGSYGFAPGRRECRLCRLLGAGTLVAAGAGGAQAAHGGIRSRHGVVERSSRIRPAPPQVSQRPKRGERRALGRSAPVQPSGPCSLGLSATSQNKPATSNQPAVLFSQNKPTPAISHQLNEQTGWRRPRIGHRWASSWRTDAGGKICSVCYIPFSSSFSFSTDQSGLPLQLYS
jgi:hypothetical protein